MKLIETLEDFPNLEEVFLTIGNFDGFHLGHKKIIDELMKFSQQKESNRNRFVITFKKSPLEILNPSIFKGYVFPFGCKEEVFEKLGIDYLANLDFLLLKDITREEFVNFLKEKFKRINIFIGYDFRFGKENMGDVDFLKKNFENVFVVDKVDFDGERISSSLIRDLISNGEIEKANRMLGRNYFIYSDEIKGDGLGRRIGFPTINLKINEQILPSTGVYFTIYKLKERIFPAMTYIGKRPTIDGTEMRNETNIIGLNEVEVMELSKIKKHKIYFVKKTREEKKLHNLEELKNLLYNDREVILSLFKANGGIKDEFHC
ncbi:MAG: bifunctional riboflavin kinase/FAD synthetase [Brevinematales bacterium]|nr:bifunctional riboflavin kinase/FAD synthetase [Brevinematales bacterium]